MDEVTTLEARIGDLIWWNEDGWIAKTAADIEHIRKYPDCRIIQRGGVAFMWPETQ